MVEERIPREGSGGATEYFVDLLLAPAQGWVSADSLVWVRLRCVVSKASSKARTGYRCDLVSFVTPIPDEVRQNETLRKSMARAVHADLSAQVGPDQVAHFGPDLVDWGDSD